MGSGGFAGSRRLGIDSGSADGRVAGPDIEDKFRKTNATSTTNVR